MRNKCLVGLLALLCLSAEPAVAGSQYDGSWNLTFVTEKGECDPSNTFTVNVTNGLVSHPNLLKLRGRVANSGAVRASVSVGSKYAEGSGKLGEVVGRGVWHGRNGQGQCKGYWSAQRN